ncbi:MAG: AraC family transcriptional regulator [Bacteroidales bacterium]|nr:AraC family transcriptional regulator [Bacteroidales bacterium]
MKSDGHYRHPMLVNAQKIKENGIAILDDVRELPSGKEPFTSPDYVICIGHRGTMQMTYDDMPDHSSKQTVAVVFPNHTLRMVSKSDDYLATLVVVDAALLDDPLLRIIGQLRYRYEPHPWVELDRREYSVIMHMVGVMRETASIDIPNRQHFMMSQLEFFMRLLSHYRIVKLNETAVEKRVSTLFSNDLAQYFRDHRDVGFYAAKVCLTPKHFSTVVRQETGHTAAWWIHRQVVSEAKNLLTMRPDLNIQAVADQLGFADQDTFSRYFHRETGLYPTEYRANI